MLVLKFIYEKSLILTPFGHNVVSLKVLVNHFGCNFFMFKTCRVVSGPFCPDMDSAKKGGRIRSFLSGYGLGQKKGGRIRPAPSQEPTLFGYGYVILNVVAVCKCWGPS